MKRLKGLSRQLERLQREANELSKLVTDLLSAEEQDRARERLADRRKPRPKK